MNIDMRHIMLLAELMTFKVSMNAMKHGVECIQVYSFYLGWFIHAIFLAVLVCRYEYAPVYERAHTSDVFNSCLILEKCIPHLWSMVAQR